MTPPWRAPLDIALTRDPSPAARFVALATVRVDGRPANRTLVFRGFAPDGVGILFTTDWRSAKVVEAERAAWAEACWYFPTTREQVRLTGRLDLIGAADVGERSALRRVVWAGLTDAARAQFTWPTPGAARAPDDAFAGPSPDPKQPPLTFGILVLAPERVDHLELAVTPHRRMLYERDGDGTWTVRAVNP